MSNTSNAAKRHLELVHSRSEVGTLTGEVLSFDDDSSPDSVVIPQLPITFGRDLAPFVNYRSRLPDKVKTLSRQHARLTLSDQDGKLYVEDLGSTNGTWINDARIAPGKPVALRNGDKLMFGNGFFSFIVKLPEAEPVPAEAASADDQPAANAAATATGTHSTKSRTVYLSAVTSFFSIFCESETPAQHQSAPDASGAAGKRPAKRPGKLRKAGAVAREIKTALSDQPRQNRRGLWIATGLLALAVALGGGIYLYGAPKREIATLLAQQQYRQSLIKANAYLSRNPQADDVRRLAADALIKAVVPAWQRALQSAEFADAQAQIDSAAAAVSANPEGQRLLQLLSWITDMQRFIAARGGLNAPITLFRDEQALETLLARWDGTTQGKTSEALLVRIANTLPEFRPLRVKLSSELRALQSEQSVYSKASRTLRDELSTLLLSDNPTAAGDRLTQFFQRYPRAAGGEPLRQDIDQFIALRQAVAEQNLGRVIELYPARYQTRFVGDIAARWIGDRLPSSSELKDYEQVLSTWRRGDAAAAVAKLKTLQQQTWGELAAAKRARFTKVAASFSALNSAAAADEDERRARLLAFYQMLNPAEDDYFIDAVDDQAKLAREAARAEAERLLDAADEIWLAYRDAGGISGLMRLEDDVSETFREQAARLSEALSLASRGQRLYRLSGQGTAASDDLSRRYNVIRTEALRQRQWLNDLSLVIEPALLDAKLALLPGLPTLQENEQ